MVDKFDEILDEAKVENDSIEYYYELNNIERKNGILVHHDIISGESYPVVSREIIIAHTPFKNTYVMCPYCCMRERFDYKKDKCWGLVMSKCGKDKFFINDY